MKKRLFFIKAGYLVIMLAFLAATGCKKVFDQPNIGSITPEEVWSNPDNVKLYVNNFYSILPAWNRNETFTEEGGTINGFLNDKQQTSSGFPDGVNWSGAYSNIRDINTFFQNINTVPSLDDDTKDILKGQAYFFLAYQYYLMLKVYGGVPLITTVQSPLDSTITMVKRDSSLECFDFIVKKLDSAIDLLPSTWQASDLGRITKGAAMAVKGEVLMLKASPLFNPAQNHPEYWAIAYNACNDALTELNADGYGLYTNGGAEAYTNMWYDKTGAQKSWILYVRYNYPEKAHSLAGQRPLSVSVGAAGSTQPTWEMVEAYPMENGKSINDPTSGYNPVDFWKNRDPRFYQTIVYNGARYGFGSNVNRIQWIFPQMYPDGYMGQYGSQTGFYCRKEIDTTLTLNEVSQHAFNWPIIRYAEVLLDVAECANEVGQSAIAKSNIILIRKRAGIHDDDNGNYGLSADVGVDHDATLKAIMKEREIEFAYEGKRFWDLRRRRMFNVLNNYGTWHANGPHLANTENTVADTTGKNLQDISAITTYFGSLIHNPPSGISADSVINAVTDYKIEVIDKSTDNTIKIPDTYYFWPLNPNWIQKDPNLEQNKGWDKGAFDPTIH